MRNPGNLSNILKVMAIVLPCLIIWTGCEKELEINAEHRKSQLVVNAAFHPDAEFEVHISQSLGITQPGSLDQLEDAEVIIQNLDDGSEEMLMHSTLGFYYKSGFRPREGANYHLTVKHRGYPTATAVNRVPMAVRAQFVDSSRTYRQTFKVLDIELDIKDRHGERNYYIIDAVRNLEIEEEGELVPIAYINRLITEDPFSENENFGNNMFLDRIYLPDSKFDGEQYRLKFSAELFAEAEGGNLEIFVKSVSKDLYDYLKSLEQFNLYGNDPNFSSPVQVKNNITNGLGIFGGFTQQCITLIIEPKTGE